VFVCTTTHHSLKVYCVILVKRSNFHYQASPRVSPHESTQRWREMSRNFAEMTTSTPFRDLLRAVKLRRGTDSFTSPPKEDVPRIFSPQKSDGYGWV